LLRQASLSKQNKAGIVPVITKKSFLSIEANEARAEDGLSASLARPYFQGQA